MKLAFSTIGCPAYVWTDIYPMAKDLGFDGIEIRGVAGNDFAPTAQPFLPRRRSRTNTQLSQLGLEIPCFSTSCELCSEDGRAQAMSDVADYLELASEMNTPYVRVLLSRDIHPIGLADDGPVINALRELGDLASIYDVCVLIETESDYADSARLARVLDAVDSPYVAALWDLQHPYRIFGEAPEVTIANLGKHLRYCQVKDSVEVAGTIEYRMMGEGDMPLVQMFDALRDAGYDGYLSFEWVRKWARDLAIGEPGIVFPQFINYMHEYFSGGDAVKVDQIAEPRRAVMASVGDGDGELQHSLTNDGTYPWPKEHLIDHTFPQVLDHICKLYPEQYAFRYTEPDSYYNPEPDENGEFYVRTYPQFRDDVDEFARTLIALGVRPGDQVAIWASNVPQWYLTFWAAVKIGAVLVTVNTGYKIHELEYLLRQSDTNTLVMIDAYKGTSYLDIVDELIPQVEAEHGLSPTARAICGYSLGGLFSLYALTHADAFAACACLSGSVWYEGWVEHLRELPLDLTGRFAYLSLGTKERRAARPILKTVQDRMEVCADILRARGCEVAYRTGPGNHLQHIPERFDAGISALDAFLSQDRLTQA